MRRAGACLALVLLLAAGCARPDRGDDSTSPLEEVLEENLDMPFPDEPTPCLETRAMGASSDEAPVALFASAPDFRPTYRIPALMRTLDQDLLLLAERRNLGTPDVGDIDIVMRRSQDNGVTWGPIELVVDNGPHTVGNPTLVYDLASERLLLLSVWRPSDANADAIREGTASGLPRVKIMESEDHGRTWSEPRDITHQAKLDHWRNLGIGPGRGMQFIDGPWEGRIVVTGWHGPQGGSFVLLSDDGGREWRVGAHAGGDANGIPNEAVLAAFDHRLMFVMRLQEASVVHRTITWSEDGGESFIGAPVPATDLPGPRVHGSLLVCRGAQPELALHLAPRHPTERRMLCLRIWEGDHWSPGGMVEAGPSAYSDMVDLGDGRIAVVYETGSPTPHGGLFLKRISWEDALAPAACP